MSEQYTAREMREAAEFFERNAEMVRRVVKSNSVLANIHEVIPMLRQAADMMEREERDKKYEFATMTDDGWVGRLHFNLVELIDDTLSDGDKIVRREVGEWEEVKDGE